MNTNIDITQIITVIITALVIPFIKIYIVPLIQAQVLNIKSKMTASQWQTVLKLVTDAVVAAETMPMFADTEKAGQEKLEYVMKSVKATCEKYGLTYDEAAIKNAVQSSWNELFNKANPNAKQVLISGEKVV